MTVSSEEAKSVHEMYTHQLPKLPGSPADGLRGTENVARAQNPVLTLTRSCSKEFGGGGQGAESDTSLKIQGCFLLPCLIPRSSKSRLG